MSERNWFSNFVPFDNPMEYQGMKFLTVENFYQAMKTKDVDMRMRISKMTPSQAKRAGKSLTLRSDWDEVKLKVMEYALRHKFQTWTKQYQMLLAHQGDIVEWNTWHDNYWGVCQCGMLTQSPYGVKNCTGGQNHLGKLLMQLRQEILKSGGGS